MKKEDLRIVYMGTPEFAVEHLRCLVEGGYNVVGVITMPDKPAGRGHKVQFSPVKQYALEHDLPLLQPEKLKDETFVGALRAWNADLQIVVAFRMLPEVVWNMPRLGTFNLEKYNPSHGSFGKCCCRKPITNGRMASRKMPRALCILSFISIILLVLTG